MKTHHRIAVTLTLEGPILTRGGHSPDAGIDAPMAADAQGRNMLPFSLIKGKVLDAFRDLRPKAFETYTTADGKKKYRIVDKQLVSWFGREPKQGYIEPERGRLRFGDFATDEKGNKGDDAVIERIQINQDTGSVGRGMLMMIEAPFGYGQPVVFKGNIEFIADDSEAKAICTGLEQALRWVPAYGAMRTVGFGRAKAVKAELKSVATSLATAPSVFSE